MKKILMILLFSMTAYFSQAQSSYSFSQTASNPTGAITNTSVDTMTYTLSRSYPLISIQPVVTKASGTMAGWAVLDFSVDGTNWTVGTDTVSLSNQTVNTGVITKQIAARYLRLRVGGATTVTGTITAKVSAVQ